MEGVDTKSDLYKCLEEIVPPLSAEMLTSSIPDATGESSNSLYNEKEQCSVDNMQIKEADKKILLFSDPVGRDLHALADVSKQSKLELSVFSTLISLKNGVEEREPGVSVAGALMSMKCPKYERKELQFKKASRKQNSVQPQTCQHYTSLKRMVPYFRRLPSGAEKSATEPKCTKIELRDRSLIKSALVMMRIDTVEGNTVFSNIVNVCALLDISTQHLASYILSSLKASGGLNAKRELVIEHMLVDENYILIAVNSYFMKYICSR